MKAICEDGTEIECANFTAIDSGVLLTRDRKREQVIGFVPNGELRYVVPQDTATKHGRDIEERTTGGGRSDRGPSRSEREHEPTHEDVAMLRDRLDRLEARLGRSTADDAERSTATDGSDERDDRSDESGPESEAEPSGAESGGAKNESDEAERGAGEDRTAADDTEGTEGIEGTETERTGVRGFDPVAIVARQDDPEASTCGTERTGSDGSTDLGAVDVGRSDPVATIAQRTGKSADERGEGTTEPSAANEDSQESDGSDDDAGGKLQRIDGLGPTYAGRLEAEGIETLADLEATDAAAVASIAEVSDSRAEGWIERAGELTA